MLWLTLRTGLLQPSQLSRSSARTCAGQPCHSPSNGVHPAGTLRGVAAAQASIAAYGGFCRHGRGANQRIAAPINSATKNGQPRSSQACCAACCEMHMAQAPSHWVARNVEMAVLYLQQALLARAAALELQMVHQQQGAIRWITVSSLQARMMLCAPGTLDAARWQPDCGCPALPAAWCAPGHSSVRTVLLWSSPGQHACVSLLVCQLPCG